MIRTAIVGCGRISNHHLRFLKQMNDVEIVWLADSRIEFANALGQKYGVPRVFTSIDNLLNNIGIDVLHILTPPTCHFELGQKAAEKGINLFIEKPMTISFDQARKMLATAETHNVKICPDFINLFNPTIIAAKAAIKKGQLGQLLSAECYMSIDLTATPEVNEQVGLHWSYNLPFGIMQNYISHPLYLVLDWVGLSNKISVHPRSFGSLPQKLTDHLEITIEGKKCCGKIVFSMAGKHESYYIKLFFEKGVVTVDFMTQSLLLESTGKLPRAVERFLINFSRSQQLIKSNFKNLFGFLGGKVVPYQGLGNLLSAFYNYVKQEGRNPISRDLILDVARAEEYVLQNAGKVKLDFKRYESMQHDISRREKILVTGASGYLGREVVHQLVDAGFYVRAFVRKISHTSPLKELNVEILSGDIRDSESLQAAAAGMDVIIHMAAGLKGSKSFILDTCIEGTKNLSQAACKANVSRVIYISSFSVYSFQNLKDGSVVTEETALEKHPEQRGIYSWAKRRAEDVALSNLAVNGPAWTILRPSVIFGNGRDIQSLIGPKLGNIIISFGGKGKYIRSVHVKDMAAAIVISLTNESTKNNIFNVSHPDRVTVAQLEEEIFRKNSQKKIRVVCIPYSMCLVGMGLVKGLQLVLRTGSTMNRVRLAYLTRGVVADGGGFTLATGWLPGESLIGQLKREFNAQK